METMLHSESRRLYSWWWDSHISPKNSKWLQDNLADIDAKVKTMIKLIEEDADSFARRAEMYYKKRPELMKLVEEFYRAYRALAERYDHATSELRHAQKTIAAAFPNQVPFDDSASGSEQDPQTLDMLHPLRVLLNADFGSEESKKGLKKLQEMFGALEGCKVGEENERGFEGDLSQLCDDNQNLKSYASKAENEIKNLKKALEDLHSEKEVVLSKYEESMEKLSILEGELGVAKKSSRGLSEESCKAKVEVQQLKEALMRFEAEKDVALSKLNENRERITKLEAAISLAQKDEEGLMGRAVKAEAEAQCLEEELSKLKMKNNAVCREYEQCLEKVSDLERKLSLKQDEARLLNERADKAENEVRGLNKVIAEASDDKQSIVRRYEHCLEKMTKLESELSSARDDINRLNSAVKMKSEKLKNVEEKCTLLKASNQALELETDNLEKKITVKNEELSRKDEEIERLQSGLQNDRTLFVQAEDALQTLQSLYTKAQKEQKALALELKNGLKNLNEMKERNNGLEEEMKHVNNENKVLNESNSSSKMVMRNLESEILNLKEMKGRLENEVGLQMGLTNALHKEIHSLNENIEGLNTRYQDLIEQIESVGLNPKSLESSVKDLHDGNSKLRELCNKERDEKENLVKKLDNMKQFLDKNATLESSLSASSGKLEKAHGKVKSLQDDKSSLVHEKAVILTQLQAITENMQNLLERNTFLENSLSGANDEISSLMEKAICLEDLCKSLNNDKSNLLNETSTLVLQLGDAEKRREELEKRYVELEKEKESTISLVEELKTCLDIEKQERAIFTFSSETRLNRLEDHVHLLQEDNRSRKKEFEEELDRAVNAQLEIFVLQRFIQDMEQKNMSLLLECQKHVEASKLSDKVISELESENLEQQMEAELLLDEIKKLRMGIYQVLKALDVNPNHLEKMENDKLFFHRVVENIEDLKFSLTKYEFDKDLLLIENSVLLTLFGQLKLEASEFELEKNILQQDFNSTCDQLVVEQNEKTKILDINRQLTSDVKLRDQQTDELKIEIEKLCEEQREMKRAYVILGDEHSRKLEENKCMLKSLLDLKVKNSMVEEENDSILIEALALYNTSKVFELFGAEKAEEAKSLLEDLEKLDGLKRDLENEVGDLKNELEMKETENSFSKKEVEKLGEELNEVRDINSKLTRDLSIGKYFSNQKKVELLMVTEKLKAKEEVNSQLCRTVDELKRKNGETVLVIQNLENHYLYLFEENKNQETEIENLRDFNGSLEFEVGMLREEVEERKIREEKLSSELKEISNQLQMWEPKAEKFYFDCQISNVREVFLENKVRELICVCEMLGNERDSRMIEIEQTKERVSFLESENGGLKHQLSQYNPIIDSLRDDIMSIEQNIICRQEQHITGIHTSEDNELEANRHGKSSNELIEDDEFLVNRISELQQLQNRINQVEKVVKEEMKRRSKLKRSKTNTKLGAAMREIEELKANYSLLLGKGKQKQKSELSQRAMRKTKPEILETKNGMIMTKDIQLDDISNDPLSGVSRRRFQRADDQMLEQWETSEDDHSLGRISKKSMKKAFGLINMSRKFENVEPRSVDTSSEIQVEKELGIDRLEVPTSGSESTHNRNKKKVLERLICDAHKLKSIQTTVEDLRSKMQANKLQKKKAKNFDFEMLHEQFEEVEDTIIQLVEVNEKLRRSVEEHFAYSDKKATPELEVIGNLRRKRVVDQARKGTEKIGRLLIEVQKIQYALLKLEDEKKTKGKIRFPKSKTSIILRDFITGRRRSSQKKKNPYFGCLRNKTNGEDTSIGEFTYLRYE